MKPTMTKIRKKCVSVAKLIAKARDKNTCQKCRKKCYGSDCHWSHVIPESRNKVLSCEPRNIKVLCYRCHTRWHEHPTESGLRYAKQFADNLKRLVEENKKSNGSIGIEYFIEKLSFLKNELKKLLKTV